MVVILFTVHGLQFPLLKTSIFMIFMIADSTAIDCNQYFHINQQAVMQLFGSYILGSHKSTIQPQIEEYIFK